jgi:CDGSH-type Zn-finger protein
MREPTVQDDGFIADTSPYLVEVEAGKTYFWCACGRSKNQPFCDGSHAGTAALPKPFKAERSEAVNLCGCKQTMDPPFCDGTHNVL